MKSKNKVIETLLCIISVTLCIIMFFSLQNKTNNNSTEHDTNSLEQSTEKAPKEEYSDYFIDKFQEKDDKNKTSNTTLRLPPLEENTTHLAEPNTNTTKTQVSPEKVVINQGDVIYNFSPMETIGDNMNIETIQSMQCTVGFVQKPENLLWTSSHCFKDGDIVYDKDFNKIGIADRYYDGDIFKDRENPDIHFLMSKDFTIIHLEPYIIAGKNYFSGDSIVPNDSTSPEEEVCSFSRMENKSYCGRILEKHHLSDNYDSLLWSNLPIIKGDSGGPVWIKGKGILGIQSGFLNTENNDKIGIIKLPYDNVSTKTYIKQNDNNLIESS